MICPQCLTSKNSWWHQCPLHEGEPVCSKCHSECEYNRDTHNGPGCAYRRYHPKADHTEELTKIDNRIRAKTQKQKFYYDRGWMQGGHKIGLEIAHLKRQRRELEKR